MTRALGTFLRRVDIQHAHQRFARTGDAAFDRADRAAANLGSFLIRQTARTHQKECRALAGRQCRQRAVHFTQFKFAVVIRQYARFGQS